MKRASITQELAYGTALDRLTGATRLPTPTKAERLPPQQPDTVTIKLSVFLSREEDAYLESLSSTAKFSGGKKLSKTKLIESMVRALRTTNLDVRGVKTEEELLNRVIAQLRQ
jgi:hypothetical protein